MKTAALLLLSLLLAFNLLASVPLQTAEGYFVPQPGQPLSFPRDHGSHPNYKIEWWYLTGHLDAPSGERFGYQATFFRRALKAPTEQLSDQDEPPSFGDEQLYLAHMGLTDVDGQRFFHQERFNRDGWDALSATKAMDVRNGNWRLHQIESQAESRDPSLRLQFTIDDSVAVDLHLTPSKSLLVFGQDGTSRKGADPAARSYYLTWSRLESTGTVAIDDKSYSVSGESWMDHEIASMQLGDGLEGWDWTAIQLNDNWEIKAYILRQDDGLPSPFSALIWIDPAGNKHYRSTEDFSWKTVRSWTSPETESSYPIELTITTIDPRTDQSVTLRLKPVMDAQELSNGSAGFAYWEGACDVLDDEEKTIGRAYLELVGYGGSTGDGLR